MRGTCLASVVLGRTTLMMAATTKRITNKGNSMKKNPPHKPLKLTIEERKTLLINRKRLIESTLRSFMVSVGCRTIVRAHLEQDVEKATKHLEEFDAKHATLPLKIKEQQLALKRVNADLAEFQNDTLVKMQVLKDKIALLEAQLK